MERPKWHDVAEKNRRLVGTIAAKFKRGLPSHIDMKDLVAAGYIGLCEAAKTFDRAKASFSTYAWRRIKGAMLDWLRSIDYVPRQMRTHANKTGTEHTLPKMMSLDDACDDDTTKTWNDVLESPNGCPVKHAINKEWPKVYQSLNEREQAILDGMYRNGKTMKQVGISLGLSESRICQMHKRIVERWRMYLSYERKIDAQR